MTCQECGKENSGDSHFCIECGSHLARKREQDPPPIEKFGSASDSACPRCRSVNSPESAFCIECGARLKPEPKKETPHEQPKSSLTAKPQPEPPKPILADRAEPRIEPKPLPGSVDAIPCPSCGTHNPQSAAFCIECGAPLKPEAEKALPPASRLEAGPVLPPVPPKSPTAVKPQPGPPKPLPEKPVEPAPLLKPEPSPEPPAPAKKPEPVMPAAPQPIPIAEAKPPTAKPEPGLSPEPAPPRAEARPAPRPKAVPQPAKLPAASRGACPPIVKAQPPASPSDSSSTATLTATRKDFTTGEIFAERYQIVEELGQGGMGRVYRALDKKVNEEIAIKVVKAEIVSEPRVIERFSNELRNARRISHKNICRMYDLLESEGVHFITMEYVPGENLKSFIRRSRRLAVGTALAIAKQVAEGLGEAHRLGVVHRDLKPQNIMIDKEGNVRIMDFGIASSLKTQGITGQGVMIGTPDYISPEQFEGKGVDARTDLYALGVVLYEMVTGRVPFEGDTPLNVAVMHKNLAPPDPSTFNPQIPEELRLLILRCLEKDKEKRYAGAGEIWNELQKIEQGIPAAERALPRPKQAGVKEITVSFRPKRLILPAVIVASLVVVASAVWFFVLRPGPERKPAPVASAPAAKIAESARPNPTEVRKKLEALGPAGMPAAPPQKVEKKPPSTTPTVKPPAIPMADVSDQLARGIEAFHQKDYDGCLQHMRAVLRADPNNKTAQRYIAEADIKKREAELTAPLLQAAEDAYRNGRLEQCLELARKIQAISPDNGQAVRYEDQVQQKLAPGKIKAAVDAFVQAMNSGQALAFYETSCQPSLYQRIKREVGLVNGMYQQFQTRASQVTIRFPEKTRAEVRFVDITTGVLKSENRRMVIFEGTYVWSMEREADNWLITDIQSLPARK